MAKAKKSKKVTTAKKHVGVDDHSFIIIAGGALVIILLAVLVFASTSVGRNVATTQGDMKEVVDDSTIQISGSALMPEAMHVKNGAKVTWLNNDTVSHVVKLANGNFDSKELMTGERSSYTFDTVGEYTYTVDGVMTGTVVVE